MSHSGEEEERYFLNVADFGIGGEVVKKVNENRLKRKASSYLRCLVSTFLSYRNKRVCLNIDGKELPIEEYLVGTVSNGRIFGKGKKIAPQAKLDDGFLDVVILKNLTLPRFLISFPQMYIKKKRISSKILETHKVKTKDRSPATSNFPCRIQ